MNMFIYFVAALPFAAVLLVCQFWPAKLIYFVATLPFAAVLLACHAIAKREAGR